MKMTGADIIDKIATRLDEQDIRCYDTNIIACLRNLTAAELAQLVNLGDVIQWHNDRINKKDDA